MDSTNDRDSTKPHRLTFSREYFTDYYTALVTHWRAAIRILRYLVNTKSLDLTYKRGFLTPTVSAYADSTLDNE